jgi:glycosyltransferase involved in cell wall biosynthesis
MSTPLVSIVVPTFNRRDSLRRMLLTLRHQTWPAESLEIVVVDNGSTDDTAALARAFESPSHITVIQQEKRRKYECARPKNTGVAHARGDVLLFLDSDLLVPRDFVRSHVRAHLAHRRTVVAGKILYLEHNDRLTDELLESDWEPDMLGTLHLKGQSLHRFLDLSANLPQYLRPWELCLGGNLSIRADSFHEVGPFDEEIDGDDAGGEDLNFVLRACARGLLPVYSRFSCAVHERNIPLRYADAPHYFDRRRDAVQRTRMRAHDRWLPPRQHELVSAHTRVKRGLERVLCAHTGRLTLEAKRSIACRLLPVIEAGYMPTVSLLLISDADQATLRHALEACQTDKRDMHAQFEVIVLDPDAPTGDTACTTWPCQDIVVQTTPVEYLLRYFPTLTEHRHAQKQGHHGVAADLAQMRRRAHERYLRDIFEQKPYGLIAIPVFASDMSTWPRIDTVLLELEQLGVKPGDRRVGRLKEVDDGARVGPAAY